MNLSLSSLIVAGIAPTQARQFLEPLTEACARFDIDTPARLAGFIAQCRVESRDFTALEENLNYRSPERLRAIFPSRVHSMADAAALVAQGPRAIANRVYADKNGNGDETSGDGWKYRGRGLIQLTGRANYKAASATMSRGDLVSQWYVDFPDEVSTPHHACLTAAWYWHTHNLNRFADSVQWDAITRAVNGPGMLHADLRRQYSEEGVQAFT